MTSVKYHKTSQLGKRPTNEDSEVCFLNLDSNGNVVNKNYAPVDLFIICDGHNGNTISEYVSRRLHEYLRNPSIIYPASKNVLVNVFKSIHNELKENFYKESYVSGTTALVVIRCFDKDLRQILQVINCGDCRAVMSESGRAIPLTIDHKPNLPGEKKRISIVNEKVSKDRVEEIWFDGDSWRVHNLSVSRALGDFDSHPQITYIPDIYNYYVKSNNSILIMGCDGLWDEIDNSEAINFVYDHYYDNQIETYNIEGVYPTSTSLKSQNIAHKLATYAIARGSSDNVSVIIIFFK